MLAAANYDIDFYLADEYCYNHGVVGKAPETGEILKYNFQNIHFFR